MMTLRQRSARSSYDWLLKNPQRIAFHELDREQRLLSLRTQIQKGSSYFVSRGRSQKPGVGFRYTPQFILDDLSQLADSYTARFRMSVIKNASGFLRFHPYWLSTRHPRRRPTIVIDPYIKDGERSSFDLAVIFCHELAHLIQHRQFGPYLSSTVREHLEFEIDACQFSHTLLWHHFSRTFSHFSDSDKSDMDPFLSYCDDEDSLSFIRSVMPWLKDDTGLPSLIEESHE